MVKIEFNGNGDNTKEITIQQTHVLVKPPALEYCGPYLDGKARRRERRKLERLKRKKK